VVTDPAGERLAELQLTLVEGPCHDVLASAAPVLADAATLLLLDGLRHDGGGAAAAADGLPVSGQSSDLALHRAEIDRATGMLTMQLGTGIAEAFARLRAYAYRSDRRLADVASDIVARRLRLHRDPGGNGGP
jgi:hypothetical protein